MEESGFSQTEQQNPTNGDIVVTYTPHSSVTSYSYQICKNQICEKAIVVESANPSTIVMNQTGTFQIKIVAFEQGEQKTYESGNYQIDKEAPQIVLQQNLVEITKGMDDFNPLTYVKSVIDNQDGNLKEQIKTNIEELDLQKLGLQKLTYTVQDQAGNVSSATLNINIKKDMSWNLFFIQGTFVLLLLMVIGLYLLYRRSAKLERRVLKYTVPSLKTTSPSLFDHLIGQYQRLIIPISKAFKRSVFLEKYAQKYEKYVHIVSDTHTCGMDFIATKCMIGLCFVLIAFFVKAFQFQLLSFSMMLFPFIVGFFVPDLYYISKYKLSRNHLENDLLQAIIIMNNAFKSGRSITQAIDLVAHELDGFIQEEFQKMSLELGFGLGIDVVFERFAQRIQMEEVTYLTASLSILNQNGGNIIKVFSSIETSLFNKKKLKLQLASLTGGSKMIVKILLAIPILFIAFIQIMNPTYFTPFFQSQLGILLFFLIVLIYVFYIIVVRKVMKVRM